MLDGIAYMSYDNTKQTFCYILVQLSILLNLFTNGETKDKNITHQCCNHIKLLGKHEDLCKTIEIELGQSLKLDCHFCEEKDDGKLKVWTGFNQLTNETPIEILITSSEERRHIIKKDYSLIIKTVEANDSGIYECKYISTTDDYVQQIFKYYVDVTKPNEKSLKGNLDDWRTYVDKYLSPMTRIFQNSMNDDYIMLRDKLGVDIRVVGEWDSRQPCDGCKGIAERSVFCRLKPSDNRKMGADNISSEMLKKKKYFSVYELSCHSIQFEEVFPKIGTDLQTIPNYIIVSSCKGPCRNLLNKRGPKYHNSYKLNEGSYLTLTCPEATIENQVVWKKDGRKIYENNINQKVGVNSFGTLFLNGVTLKEAGNYTCYVDDVYMLEVEIKITGTSIFHAKELFWQSVYFLILVWINFMFFCAVLTIKWHKRETHETIEEIIKKQKGEVNEVEDVLKKIH